MNTRSIVFLFVLAGASFAVGRSGFLCGSAAQGQHVRNEPPAALSPEYEAMRAFATPSRHHRALDVLVGEWSGEFTLRPAPHSPPVTTRAAITREWVLGGRFVREIVKGEGDAEEFEGVGYIGYDNFDGHYIMVWLDTMSTGVQIDTGARHPDENVFHMRSSFRDPASGRLVNAWTKLDLADPDRHVVTGNATDVDGRTYKAMEGVLVRVPRTDAD